MHELSVKHLLQQTWFCLQYYNWRQDSYSDLQLFLVFNVGLVVLGVAIKHNLIDQLEANPEKHSIWQDAYKASISIHSPLPLSMGTHRQAERSMHSCGQETCMRQRLIKGSSAMLVARQQIERERQSWAFLGLALLHVQRPGER